MVSAIPGMIVERSIPVEVMQGLAMGQYTLHGGVVRGAAGTPLAGQIICHLLPTGVGASAGLFVGAGIVPIVGAVASVASVALGAVSLWQSHRLHRRMKQLIHYSELQLAVTQSGFHMLSNRLNQIENRLQNIQDTMNRIWDFLQHAHIADLRVSLENLEHIGLLQNPDNRRETLIVAANSLNKIAKIYEQQFAKATALREALLCEELTVIAYLATAQCYAELGETTRARQLLVGMLTEWTKSAQRVFEQFIFDDMPQKFLGSDFAPHISIVELATWMDFAKNESLGLEWIDLLHKQGEPWYFLNDARVNHEPRRKLRRPSLDETYALHTQIIIPAARKLIARQQVLHSYIAQYELMDQIKVKPSFLAIELDRLIQTSSDDSEGVLVLIPEPVRIVSESRGTEAPAT
ncbi:MAG: hypothetical protein Fur005_40120 [Roseiflexaceae bacterium]